MRRHSGTWSSEVRHRTFGPPKWIPCTFAPTFNTLSSHSWALLSVLSMISTLSAIVQNAQTSSERKTCCRCSILRVYSGCETILSYKKSKRFYFLMKRRMPPKPLLCTSQEGDSRCTLCEYLFACSQFVCKWEEQAVRASRKFLLLTSFCSQISKWRGPPLMQTHRGWWHWHAKTPLCLNEKYYGKVQGHYQ